MLEVHRHWMDQKMAEQDDQIATLQAELHGSARLEADNEQLRWRLAKLQSLFHAQIERESELERRHKDLRLQKPIINEDEHFINELRKEVAELKARCNNDDFSVIFHNEREHDSSVSSLRSNECEIECVDQSQTSIQAQMESLRRQMHKLKSRVQDMDARLTSSEPST